VSCGPPQALEHHLQEEERVLLPALAAAAEREGSGARSSTLLAQLGEQFEWAKVVAPTRPHPWMPKQPPLLVAACCLAVTPVDFVADVLAFRGAPTL
jgi:hypothetical protein